jgi:hypothetical protein
VAVAKADLSIAQLDLLEDGMAKFGLTSISQLDDLSIEQVAEVTGQTQARLAPPPNEIFRDARGACKVRCLFRLSFRLRLTHFRLKFRLNVIPLQVEDRTSVGVASQGTAPADSSSFSGDAPFPFHFNGARFLG